jgi:adenylate kinase
MKHIILFGPPGCGKGTQAELLKKSLGYNHFSTGELFRYHLKNKTAFGESISPYINRGSLVPDKLTTEMFKEAILKNQNSQGFIYDGYPRTITQAESLDKILNELNYGIINKAFALRAPDYILVERILNRSKTSERSDDKDSVIIRKRIREYYEKTSTISNYYKYKGILVELNAQDFIEEIHEKIKKELEG